MAPPKRENEVAAHALVAALAAAGVDARVEGGGVHWRAVVAPVGTRSLEIHCFYYPASLGGLLLGMNPANARQRLRPPQVRREGLEYFAVLRDGARVADGRTWALDEVVTCARAWTSGVPLDELASVAPFVDRRGRASRALAARLDPRLPREVGGDPSYELWVYGDDRSCCVVVDDDGCVSCSFRLVQAQVAHAVGVTDLPGATEAWLIDRVPIGQLASRVRQVTLERHAEVLEVAPARWHWQHVRDRLADPNDVLTPLRALIEALASSEIATRFYSYSSLARLCFSASSHYPWVDAGLPVVGRDCDGSYVIGDERFDVAHALASIETSLRASPVQPFFGSAPHHELPLFRASLIRAGSQLQPRLAPRAGWYYLTVGDGARECAVSGGRTTFSDGSTKLSLTWPSMDDAARATSRCFEGGASFDDLAADPRVSRVSRWPTR